MPEVTPALALLVAALAAAPLTALAGARHAGWASPVALLTTALAFAAALWGWARGGDRIDVAWAPTWDLRLTFELDGLATLYALLATGIGLAVVIYAGGYLPRHLAHEERKAADGTRFYAFLLLFMGAMVGLVLARDLLVIFLFWDVTAIASYFLIGYDAHRPDARWAALMAFLVTVVSAVCFLIGVMVLQQTYLSFDLDLLVARTQPGARLSVAAALMAAAALAKSAQVPFHFWLPRAMAAPTPVSAYLHSAAMVAAGVFLLSRLHPLLSRSTEVMDALLVIGFTSMLVGGVLALTRDGLKQLLAYSTISQYGYVTVMLGIGGVTGAAGASFYVVAHALAKSALFLTAGAVTEATGEKDSTRSAGSGGGSWLAAGSGAAAAGLAALPLTAGFFKDELFFHAARERGDLVAALAVGGAMLTFAYMARFWGGIFLGRGAAAVRPIPGRLVWPVVGLGALTIAGGIWPEPITRLADAAAEATIWTTVESHPAYHLDTRPENLMALAAWGGGVLLVLARPLWRGAAQALARLGERVGPERFYGLGLQGLSRASDRINRFEVHDLRGRVATILLPGGLLVLIGFLATPTRGAFNAGSLERANLPVVLMLAIAGLAAVTAAFPRDHLSLAIVLSGVGFSLAVVYAFLGAPDVALVAVLIETVFSLLFLGMLALMPTDVDHETVRRHDVTGEVPEPSPLHIWRDAALAATSGGVAFLVVWSALSKPVALESVTADLTDLTPAAHGKDIVTVILADFRGFDTMGEITVIGVAFLGIATLLRRWRVR